MNRGQAQVLPNCSQVTPIPLTYIGVILVSNRVERRLFLLAQDRLFIIANDFDLHLICVLLRHLVIQCPLSRFLVPLFLFPLFSVGFLVSSL